jgi:hypothetical protein
MVFITSANKYLGRIPYLRSKLDPREVKQANAPPLLNVSNHDRMSGSRRYSIERNQPNKF